MAILNKRRSTSQLPQLQQRSIYEPFVNLEAGERGREILRPNGVRDRGELSTGRPVTSVVRGDGSSFASDNLGGQSSIGGGRLPSLGGVTSRPITSTTSGALAPRTSIGGPRAGVTSNPIGIKPAATAPKPSLTTKTTATKPVTTAKTAAKPSIAAKPALTSKTTAKPTIATKPTTTPTKTAVTPTVKPTVKKSTGTTSKLGTALTGAALGATTKAVIDKITGKITGSPKTPVVKPPVTSVVKPTVGTPPFVPPKTLVKPAGIPTAGGVGIKPGGGPTTLKPPVAKPPVIPKAGATAKTSVAGATGALTDEQIQAELDRVKADEEANVVPEGAVTNEDGTYSVTADGMTTTYAADGSIIGMEAATDTTVGGGGEDTVVAGDGTDTTTGLTRSLTGAGGTDTVVAGTGTDTSTMTDLGEGYFQDDSGNIYGADGNLMYTLGADGEYVDANDITDTTGTTDTTEDITTYTDPDTGLTWNMGADGEWSQEGFDASAEDVTTYTDPDTGFTWNMGDDGERTQEGYEDTGYDDTLGDDTDYSLEDDTDYSLDSNDDSEIIEDAKGGLIHGKRHFVTGGPISFGYGDDEGYSDTGEEVQDFQNVDYNFGELDNPTMTDYTGTGNRNPVGNTYLRSALLDDDEGIEYPYNPAISEGQGTGLIFTPEGWPEGFVPNEDGTATYRNREDGSTMTMDAEGNIINVTDADGETVDPDRTPSTGITSTGSTGGGRYRKDPPPPPPTGGLPNNSGLFDTIKDSLGTYAGSAAAGALLASLLESADNEGGGASESGIDMSQVGVLNPRTTDFGIGPARYVGYDEYGAQDEMPEMYGNELYQNLNAPGFNPVNEGDYADPEEVQYGNEEEMAEAPEEEMSEMADGGAAYQTHYTFGKSIDPLVNLGLKSGQPMKSGGLSHGGLPAFSNVPITQGRLNFRQGAAVHGPGDGQSDDIPAMLADGEYVIDADTVAQIGNGSTKAGAAALDKFRENIRSHKRSAPINKIPPKTKALTSYLKGAR